MKVSPRACVGFVWFPPTVKHTFMLIRHSCVSEWHVNPAISPGNLLAQFVFIGAALGEHGWALLHCNAQASRHHPANAGPVTVL